MKLIPSRPNFFNKDNLKRQAAFQKSLNYFAALNSIDWLTYALIAYLNWKMYSLTTNGHAELARQFGSVWVVFGILFYFLLPALFKKQTQLLLRVIELEPMIGAYTNNFLSDHAHSFVQKCIKVLLILAKAEFRFMTRFIKVVELYFVVFGTLISSYGVTPLVNFFLSFLGTGI
ncbi:hypothetical protein [Pseudovibrio sp. WM33]|uniref:hypothetical protein n=1 Tax=Pseudovibrio sp. WM33 TaxID=1735585 RepID=UPI0007AE8BDA|nr:hypothetical protein [Pseudovibrio sp. WM33]KZL18133.1 hypothetical protein PsWM33_05120 [Pseudovibrio sp. WM33]